MILNYNIITNLHFNPNDNGLSTIIPVKDWKNRCLIIPQLNIIIKLVKGQVVMLRLSILVHGNTHVKGIRFGMVFFSHNNTFKH